MHQKTGAEPSRRATTTRQPPFFARAGRASFFPGPQVQMQSNRATDDPLEREPASTANRMSGRSLPFLDTIQSSFGHHDLSHVRTHTDHAAAAEASKLGAEAFTRGSDVTFARLPSLRTAAHEAAHVIQQRAGVTVSGGIGQEGDAYERHADEVADRVARGQSSTDLLDAPPPGPRAGSGSAGTAVQPRRIPPNVRALLTGTGGGTGPNFDAHATGALRLIDLAMAELTAAEQATVETTRRGGLTAAAFAALSKLERVSRTAEAIRSLFPGLRLGDPKLLDVLPRTGTSDAANILKVVTNANTIFAAIASGAQDPSLTQVFGAGSLAAAKAKYAAARSRMNTLHTTNHIVTDRGSGFSAEVFEGGLTGPSQISVAPDVIDDPNKDESVVTFVHESMHAGNTDIGDNLYSNAAGFQTQTAAKKLINAAHFEVVPWRIRDPKAPGGFPITPHTTPPTFKTFIPAGTTVGGVTAPALTVAQQGREVAYEMLRGTWALGLNLHRRYVQLFRTPADWTVPQPALGGIRFDNSIPFWSKVQKLTIHLKTTIEPASADEAKRPVSQIDVALSEGLTRRFAFAMDVLTPLQTPAQIQKFEDDNSTVAERSAAFPGGAHTNADVERDFLLKLALRQPTVAPMTGPLARDLRVVRLMGDPALSLWSDILKPRSPSTFAD